MSEQILNLGQDAMQERAFVSKATDPVVSNVATPGDFSAQYPTPLNTEELLAMCEEITLWRTIPEIRTALKEETWREMTSLAFTSGSSYIAFSDGACPEEYAHDGSNMTVSLKNIGAKKSLTDSDIMHSAAVAAASWNGINQIIGGFIPQGLPGESRDGTFVNRIVGDLKAKEMLLASVLVMNGWDKLLVNGNKSNNALEFDGLETIVTSNNGAHVNASAEHSGTFSAASFDRFLSESCAMPTDLFGHPQVMQEVMSAYFQLGFQGSQVIQYANGNRLVPGFNFASEINTGVGTLRVHADRNFTKTSAGGSTFQSSVFALRMSHNGMPLVYKSTQIPLSFRDLASGCTSISFEIWAKTALIVKALCAHGRYTALFTGRSVTTCAAV